MGISIWRRKDHPETIVYDCPELEEILEPTYGCIVYQEQVNGNIHLAAA